MTKTRDDATYNKATNTTTVKVDMPGFVGAIVQFNGRLDEPELNKIKATLKQLSREIFLGVAQNQSAIISTTSGPEIGGAKPVPRP